MARSRLPRRLFRLPWRTPRQIGADVDDELRFHLEMRASELVARGLAPETARDVALREFGDLEDARRDIAAVDRQTEAARRRRDYVSDFTQDLVYAARKLRSTPLFTLTAVLTLALGIGATTAIFSAVDRVLLQPPPFPAPDRLVRVRFSMGGRDDSGSPAELNDLRGLSRSFEQVAMYDGAAFNLVRAGADPERLVGVEVSANWFDLMGVPPLLGRGFAPGEDRDGAPRVAVLSEASWRSRFDGDPRIVGRAIRLNGESFTVVGVMPDGRSYPMTAQLWVPHALPARQLDDDHRGARWVAMLARTRPGVTLERVNAELASLAKRVETEHARWYNGFGLRAVMLHEAMAGELRRPLFVIMGAVALMLLIACANVANLMLVRATARESEMAVRAALGAGRARLVRQLVTESLLLCAMGGVLGLALAAWGLRALLHLAPASLPQLGRASLDVTALGVTALVVLVTGVAFGLVPALRAGGAGGGELAVALRAGARGTRSHRSSHRTKRAIVIAEVGVALVLVAGAGLLLRSFQHLMGVEAGFRPAGVLTFRVSLPGRTYDSLERQRGFATALEERLRAIPGVRRAALSTKLPLDGSDMTISFQIRGHAPIPDNQQPAARIVSATPDFFATLGIPIEQGRAFQADDRANAPRVLVVSRGFVRRHFPNEDPLGKYVELGWSRDGVLQGGTIVGVAGDVLQDALDQEAPPTVYLPYAQTPQQGLRVVLRTDVSPASVAGAARAALASVDRELPVFEMRTMEENVAASVAPQRFYATLLSIFAGVALLLAAVGLYGVIAYTVSERTHEMGVRVALGATGDRLARMVVGEGLTLAGIGVALGLAAALAAARVLRTLLYGISAADPLTFTIVALLLVLVAAAASWLPARRAARVDPLVAMRGD